MSALDQTTNAAVGHGADLFTRRPLRTWRQTVDFRGESRTVEIFDFLDSQHHYTASFGTQWAKYRNVQIDRFNGTQGSYNHLKMFTLDDLESLKGMTILEIGSGAGRFTDYLVDLGAIVISVDPSAIMSNVALGACNLIPVRADLFDIPVRPQMVDVVFCRGVIQHTANTRRAITRLFDYVKPGGTVMFDIYHLKWFTPLVSKYWIRPIVRAVSTERLIQLSEKWVPRLLRFKHRYIKPLLPQNKFGINVAQQIVPIADFTNVSKLSSEDQVRWSILDTVDMYTPRYDSPMTWKAIMRVLAKVGALNVQGDRRSFCFRAIAPRRVDD